ncbi:MAG: hypothetical protein FWC41_12790 [Firmicutes bacterium]|nr:hypothetical protein [Bacillota bacterium]
MIPRTGKCVLLNLHDNWKINYGTFDVKNPITLYVKLQTYLTPLDTKIDTNAILNSIDNYIIPANSIFSSRFIQKTTLATTKVKKDKQSCLVITLTIKQKKDVIPFDMIQSHIETLVNDFISKIISQWNFNFILNFYKK